MQTPLAALVAVVLIVAAPVQAKPLFDKRPTTIDGVRYDGERVFEGDYQAGFEVSRFVALGGKPREAMWLQGWRPEQASVRPVTWHIRFIGRRTAKAGAYGHLGAYRHMVLVTDLIDARPKPEP